MMQYQQQQAMGAGQPGGQDKRHWECRRSGKQWNEERKKGRKEKTTRSMHLWFVYPSFRCFCACFLWGAKNERKMRPPSNNGIMRVLFLFFFVRRDTKSAFLKGWKENRRREKENRRERRVMLTMLWGNEKLEEWREDAAERNGGEGEGKEKRKREGENSGFLRIERGWMCRRQRRWQSTVLIPRSPCMHCEGKEQEKTQQTRNANGDFTSQTCCFAFLWMIFFCHNFDLRFRIFQDPSPRRSVFVLTLNSVNLCAPRLISAFTPALCFTFTDDFFDRFYCFPPVVLFGSFCCLKSLLTHTRPFSTCLTSEVYFEEHHEWHPAALPIPPTSIFDCFISWILLNNPSKKKKGPST